MAVVAVGKDPYEILQEFIAGKEIDVNEILQNADLFKIELYYKNYESAVTTSVAKFMISNQNLVYKVAALLKYGKADIRRLSK